MRYPCLAILAGGLWLAVPAPAAAQNWSPPARQMPGMQVDDGWKGSLSGWFLPGTALDGVEARAERGFVRFSRGPRPVAAWSDRNGDGRTDMVQIFRASGGGVAFQLIDADYDGTADVLRVYDASGALEREERL